MAADPKHKWTPEEYLAFERASEERHEYVDGEVLDMVGASERHSWLKTNIGATLYPHLVEQGGSIYMSAMRIKAGASYLYPDIVAFCEEPKVEDAYEDTVLNPTLILEVVSPSTELYDRSKKFAIYREIPSLQTYVLVSQDGPLIEQYNRREGDIWEYKETTGLDAEVEFASIQCKLPLAQVYQGVSFNPEHAE